uniref:Uncharacterized protein n=1 Tax=Ascaris lumbricoides TaxID=6252 RepID=A0A9J2PRM9_ASCLU
MGSIIIAIVIAIWFIVCNCASDPQQDSSAAFFASLSRCYRNDGFGDDYVRRSSNSTYCYYSPKLIMNITKLGMERKGKGMQSMKIRFLQAEDTRTLITAYCNRTKEDTILTIENNNDTTFLWNLSRAFLEIKHRWQNDTMDVCVFLETDLATAKNRKTTNYLKEFLTGREACLGMNGQVYSRRSEVVLIICQFNSSSKLVDDVENFQIRSKRDFDFEYDAGEPKHHNLVNPHTTATTDTTTSQREILSKTTETLEKSTMNFTTVRTSNEGNNKSQEETTIKLSIEMTIDHTTTGDLPKEIDSLLVFMNASTWQPEMDSTDNASTITSTMVLKNSPAPEENPGNAVQAEQSSPPQSKKDADKNMRIALITLAVVMGTAELGSLTFVILVYNNVIS